MKIVTSVTQVVENIVKFEEEVRASRELQARLSYARAWYAMQINDRWWFAPSKFIGYVGIDATTYIQAAEESDGRRTEAQLQKWFNPVGHGDASHDELYSGLVSFLAQFGKAPSTKVRINVLRAKRSPFDRTDDDSRHDKIVDLMVAVAKTLPSQQFQNLREKLAEAWA
jgi:hypothetical protein